MLSSFRAIAKSKITLVILFVPLMLGLLIFGNVRDVFNNMQAKDAVVAAGSRTVSSPEFKRMFDNAKANIDQRNQQPISIEDAVAGGLLNSVLQDLASGESFLAAMDKAGVRPSDALVAQGFHKIPAFFDPVTGVFSEKAYSRTLAGAGLTPDQFIRGEKDKLVQSHFSTAMAAGLRAPAIYSALIASLELEQRTATAFGVDPRTLPALPKPTDAQLNDFIHAHAAQMMLPEQRSLTVVRFSARALEPTLKIDPAELQKRYDFRKDTLSLPEKRSIVQIPAKTQADAAAAAARLNKGEAPDAVAKSIGVDPVSYPSTPKSGISDKTIAAAAFALGKGQVSAPVQGSLGWAVVKVLDITPGHTVTLDEARASLEAELRTEQAQDKIYDVVEKYQSTHEGGADLRESAKAAGVTALDLPPVTAQGADSEGRPQALLSPKLLKTAFALPQGGESEVVDDGKGEYFAVRVDKVFPPAVPSLADRREQITALYMRDQTIRQIGDQTKALIARLKKGESLEAVAASVHSKAQTITVDRRSLERAPEQQRQMMEQIFSTKAGDAYAVGPLIVRVDKIIPAPMPQAAMMARVGQTQMAPSLFQDMADETFAWARKAMKVRVDENRARTAIGLQPLPKDGADVKSANKPAK